MGYWQEDYYGKTYKSQKTYNQAQKTKKKNEQRKYATYDNATRQSAQEFARQNGIQYDEKFYNSYNKAVTNKYREQDYLKLNDKHQKAWEKKSATTGDAPYRKADDYSQKHYTQMRKEMGYSKQSGPISNAEYDRLNADYSARKKDGTANFLKDIKDGVGATGRDSWYEKNLTFKGIEKNHPTLDKILTLGMDVEREEPKSKKDRKDNVHFGTLNENTFGKNYANNQLFNLPSLLEEKITGAMPDYLKDKKTRESAEKSSHVADNINMVLGALGGGGGLAKGAKGLKGVSKAIAKNVLSKKGLGASAIGGILGGASGYTGNKYQEQLGNELSIKEQLKNIGTNAGIGAAFGKLLGSHGGKEPVKESPKQIGHEGQLLLDAPKEPYNVKSTKQLLLPSPKDKLRKTIEYTMGGKAKSLIKTPTVKNVIENLPKKEQVNFDAQLKDLEQLHEIEKTAFAENNQELINNRKAEIESEMRKKLEQEIEFEGHQKMAEDYNKIEKTIKAKAQVKDPFTGKKLKVDTQQSKLKISDENWNDYAPRLPKSLVAPKGSGKGVPIDVVAQEHGFEDVDKFVDYLSNLDKSKKIVKGGKQNFISQEVSGNVDNVVDDLFKQSESGQRIKQAWDDVLNRKQMAEPKKELDAKSISDNTKEVAELESHLRQLDENIKVNAPNERINGIRDEMAKELEQKLKEGVDPAKLQDELKQKEVIRLIQEEVDKTQPGTPYHTTLSKKLEELKSGLTTKPVEEPKPLTKEEIHKEIQRVTDRQQELLAERKMTTDTKGYDKNQALKQKVKEIDAEIDANSKKRSELQQSMISENRQAVKNNFEKVSDDLFVDKRTGLHYSREEANKMIMGTYGDHINEDSFGFKHGQVVDYYTTNGMGKKFPNQQGIITGFRTSPGGTNYAHISNVNSSYGSNGGWVDVKNIEKVFGDTEGKKVIGDRLAQFNKDVDNPEFYPKSVLDQASQGAIDHNKKWYDRTEKDGTTNRQNIKGLANRRYQGFKTEDAPTPKETPKKNKVSTKPFLEDHNKKRGKYAEEWTFNHPIDEKTEKILTDFGGFHKTFANNNKIWTVYGDKESLKNLKDSLNSLPKDAPKEKFNPYSKMNLTKEQQARLDAIENTPDYPNEKKPIEKTVETVKKTAKPFTSKWTSAKKNGLNAQEWKFKKEVSPEVEKELRKFGFKPSTPDQRKNWKFVTETMEKDTERLDNFKTTIEQKMFKPATHEFPAKVDVPTGKGAEGLKEIDAAMEKKGKKRELASKYDPPGERFKNSLVNKDAFYLKEKLTKEEFKQYVDEGKVLKSPKEVDAREKEWIAYADGGEKPKPFMTVDESVAKVPTNKDVFTTATGEVERPKGMTDEEWDFLKAELEDETSAGLDRQSPFKGSKKRNFQNTVKEEQLQFDQKKDSFSGNIKDSHAPLNKKAEKSYAPKKGGQLSADLDNSQKEYKKMVEDFKKSKDILPLQGNASSLPELIDHLPDTPKKRLTESLEKGKVENVDFQIKETSNLFKKIVAKVKDGGLGIRKSSKLSKLVQQYGEQRFALDYMKKKGWKPENYDADKIERLNLRELKKVAPEHWEQIKRADDFFYRKYVNYINKYNDVLKGLDLDPIHIRPRSQMYKHFQDLEGLNHVKNNTFGSAGKEINNDINIQGREDWLQSQGLSKDIWNKVYHGKSVYKDDAVGGFIGFLKAASHSIHLEPVIADIRGVTKGIEDAVGPNELKRLRTALENHANDLAGHTNPLDLSFHKMFDSRRIISYLHKFNNQVQANMIVGNVGSLVGQLGGIPLNIARTGPINALKGGARTMMDVGSILGGKYKNLPISKSKFIRERYVHQNYERFNDKLLQKPGKIFNYALNTIDRVVGHFTWNGMYEKALAQKVKDPIAYADKATREVLAGRGVSEVPLFHKSFVGRIFAPFSLEVGNQWKVLSRMGRGSKLEKANLMTYMIAAYGINWLTEHIRGSAITFDPVDAVADGYNRQEGSVLRKVGASIGALIGETLSSIPSGSALFGIIGERKVPGSGGNTKFKDLMGDRDPNRFGNYVTLSKGFESPLHYLLPYGATQIDKFNKGRKAIKDEGIYNKNGEMKYPIDTGHGVKGAFKKAQLLAFGPGATKESKEYYKGKTPPRTLSPKDTLRVQNAVDKIAEYKAILQERKERAEKRKH